jgi:hypothetical protein
MRLRKASMLRLPHRFQVWLPIRCRPVFRALSTLPLVYWLLHRNALERSTFRSRVAVTGLAIFGMTWKRLAESIKRLHDARPLLKNSEPLRCTSKSRAIL